MKVYVETQEKGKTVYPYLPILDVKIEKNGKTLGAVLEEKDKEIADLKEQVSKLTVLVEEQQRATKEAFGVIINEINKEKFL